MEIHSLYLSNYKMVNPITAEVIVDEECDDNAKSLIAYWLGGFLDEPHFNNETLKSSWDALVENFNKDNSGTPFCWDALDKFLVLLVLPKCLLLRRMLLLKNWMKMKWVVKMMMTSVSSYVYIF